MFGSKGKPYKGQDYKKLRAECIKNGTLFVDTEFPPNSKSLSYSGQAPSGVEWKRPGELIHNPKLFVDGASAEDFSQGALGNCWFVAACAAIAQEPKLWKKIVPDYEKQDWGDKNPYTGIFHFRFFRLGVWYDVVIDDFLPSRNGELVYCSSKSNNEFWGALLEKAYAKIFGDYESLKSGHAKDALVDMMGGVGESLKLEEYKTDEKKKKQLFKLMEEAYESHSLMSAAICGKNFSTEQKLDTGLIATHAYSLTSVRDVKLGSGAAAFFKRDKIKMVRCRNPWGEKEWTGAWGDNSEEWKRVGDKEKKQMGLTFSNDGEFWMSFEDFCTQFTDLDICHMINTSIFTIKKSWRENLMFGEWKKPLRAGGCFNHKDTRLHNPQYMFDMKEEEGEILLSLEQEDARIWQEFGKKNATIGITICKADLNRKCRMHDVYDKVDMTTFVNTRSIFHRMTLKRGRYLVVPATFDPGHEGRFMLRIYARKDADATELTLDAPKQGGCMGPKYKAVTSITMVKAQGLIKQDVRGGGDPYCIIRTDKQEVKTPHIEDNLNPEWNWRATFYKKKVVSDIMVEVWNRNLGRDELMGQFTIMGASQNYRKEDTQAFRMLGKGKQAQSYMPGTVYVQLKHYRDLSEA